MYGMSVLAPMEPISGVGQFTHAHSATATFINVTKVVLQYTWLGRQCANLVPECFSKFCTVTPCSK